MSIDISMENKITNRTNNDTNYDIDNDTWIINNINTTNTNTDRKLAHSH